MMKRTLLGLLAGMLLLGAGSPLFARAYQAKVYTRRGVAPRRITRANYVPHELLVKFKSGTPDFVRKEINRGASAKVLRRFSGDSRLEHIRLPENVNLDAAIAYYSSRADVQYAQKNFIYHTLAAPDDPLYAGQWALAHMNAPAAWDKTTGRFTVVVALIDTGVDYTHPDLALNIWTNPAEAGVNCTDGVDNDPQNDVDGLPFVDDCRGWNFWDFNNDPMDLNGHGTEMAGAIGAMGNDAIGIAGANWDIQIMPLKVTAGDTNTSNTAVAIQALEYATVHGAKLVNYSMGTTGFDPAFRDAIADAANSNVLFITGAGNSGTSNDTTPFYPCDFTRVSVDNPTPPQNIVCVAATDENDMRASFTNTGSTVQLGAPGTDIVTTTPLSLSVGSDPYVVSGGGTSFSAAYVSVGAALVKSCQPNLDANTIKGILLGNTQYAGDLDGYTTTSGIVNYQLALDATGTCDSTTTTSTPVADPGGPYTPNNTRKAVFFDGTNSTDTGGNLLLYYWDFGDGTYGVGAQVTHYYASRGIYTAVLYVRDDQGVVAHQSVSVNVGHYHTPQGPKFFSTENGRSGANRPRGGGTRIRQ